MIKTEDYKREFLFIVFARKKLIYVCTIGFFLLGLFVSFLWPATYVASGTFLVKGKKTDRNPESLEQVQVRVEAITKADLYSEVQILTSNDVATLTLAGLRKNPSLYAALGLRGDDEQQTGAIIGKLKTEVVPSSNVIKARYYAKSPAIAEQVLRILMNAYIFHRMGIYSPEASKDFFSGQVSKYRDEMSKKSDKLLAMSRRSKIVNPELEIQNNLANKKELEQVRFRLKGEAIDLQVRVTHMQAALNDSGMNFFSFIENSSINTMGDQLQLLMIKREDLLRDYQPTSHKVSTVSEQIKHIYRALKKEVSIYLGKVEADLASVEAKLAEASAEIAQINDRNVLLKQHQTDSISIQKEKDLLLYSFETFFKRNEEASTSNTPGLMALNSYVTILADAKGEKSAVFPRKKLLIPLSAIVGMLIGFVVAFFSEYFDHTFKKPNDIENYAGMPVIFSVTYDGRLDPFGDKSGRKKKKRPRPGGAPAPKETKKESGFLAGLTGGGALPSTKMLQFAAFIGALELAFIALPVGESAFNATTIMKQALHHIAQQPNMTPPTKTFVPQATTEEPVIAAQSAPPEPDEDETKSVMAPMSTVEFPGGKLTTLPRVSLDGPLSADARQKIENRAVTEIVRMMQPDNAPPEPITRRLGRY